MYYTLTLTSVQYVLIVTLLHKRYIDYHRTVLHAGNDVLSITRICCIYVVIRTLQILQRNYEILVTM